MYKANQSIALKTLNDVARNFSYDQSLYILFTKILSRNL